MYKRPRRLIKPISASIQYPGKKAQDIKDHPEIPAVVRLELWFGREEYQVDWSGRAKTEGEFCIYAETVSLMKNDTA